jgi:uncharacterized protein YcsI (UPF0317 family)
MLSAERAPWTMYHNIVGVVPSKTLLGRVSEEGDGVVALESARAADAVTEVTVPADHMVVHKHPLAILEVRRILLEHVGRIDQEVAAVQQGTPVSLIR